MSKLPPTGAWFESLESRKMLAGTTLGVLADEFVYNDIDGDMVTIRHRGAGTVDITLVDDAADLAECDTIVFHNSDATTRLDVSVRKSRIGPGDGTTTIASITGDTVGSLFLKNATLAGEGVNLTGSLGSFSASGFANGADLLLGAGARPLKLDLVALDGEPGNDVTISTAGSIAQLLVRQPASGFVIETGGDLTNARFDRAVSGGTLRVGGDVKSLDLRSGVQGLDVAVGGKLTKFLLTGNGSGLRVSVADAMSEWSVKKGKGQAGALSDTRVSVGGTLRKVDVAGEITDSIFASAGDVADFTLSSHVRETLILAGATLDGDFGLDDALFGVATIKTVSIKGDFEDSIIAAGGAPGIDGLFSTGDVLAGGKISRLKIGGIISAVDSIHPNPGIYAETLGPVSFEGRVGPAVIG